MEIFYWIRILLLGVVLSSCTLMNETPIPADIEIPVIPSSTYSEAPAQTTRDLDLQEANVLDVRFEKLDEFNVRFDVTLLHDDVGESPSFADSWQVEDLDGIVLGERILAHGHGTAPFTRSATIQIPEGMDMVVVRGHDMEHGFGGQAALVNMTTGEVQLFDEDNEIAP
ncbi:MAG: hypothetical protein GQ524_07695 [Anaerolineales bacterium]|nr:hypothetical protein [Anaerolineales bacterium]